MEERFKRITFKKLKLDQLRPLSSDIQRSLDDWLRVELTYTSNAIEGNTLTRVETAELIEKGTAATIGKPLRDQLEALNHAKAVDWVVRRSHSYQNHSNITQDDILALHKLILTGINDEWAGQYRRSQVFVKGSTFAFPPPQSVPYAMDEFIQWLKDTKNEHPVHVHQLKEKGIFTVIAR